MFILQRAVWAILTLSLFLLPVYGECADISSPNIVVNLPSRTLELYSGSDFVKAYPVAIGKPSTPTPMGNYSILNKEVDPVWIPPRKGYVVPSGPDNPLGYRWMGFLPMYGIHGTNAPWAIGLAVSNGCVRMHEEDAEELFDIVDYGTPVRVTYDRVKVRVNGSGQVSVGIYPDIYGYKQLSVGDVYSKLAEYGLGAVLSEDNVYHLIREEADKQVPVAQIVRIKVNDKQLDGCAVHTGEGLFVPVWKVAAALGVDLKWDEAGQVVRTAKRSAPGMVRGDVLYVLAENVPALFGGEQLLKEDENCLEFNTLSVMVNNKAITQDVQMIGRILAIPVLPVSVAMGKQVKWDASKGILTINYKNIPYELVDGQPYLQITKINEYFGAHVYWNQPEHRIEITYPIK